MSLFVMNDKLLIFQIGISVKEEDDDQVTDSVQELVTETATAEVKEETSVLVVIDETLVSTVVMDYGETVDAGDVKEPLASASSDGRQVEVAIANPPVSSPNQTKVVPASVEENVVKGVVDKTPSLTPTATPMEETTADTDSQVGQAIKPLLSTSPTSALPISSAPSPSQQQFLAGRDQQQQVID